MGLLQETCSADELVKLNNKFEMMRQMVSNMGVLSGSWGAKSKECNGQNLVWSLPLPIWRCRYEVSAIKTAIGMTQNYPIPRGVGHVVLVRIWNYRYGIDEMKLVPGLRSHKLGWAQKNFIEEQAVTRRTIKWNE